MRWYLSPLIHFSEPLDQFEHLDEFLGRLKVRLLESFGLHTTLCAPLLALM